MKYYSSTSTFDYMHASTRHRCSQPADMDSNPIASRPFPKKVAFVETTTIYEVPSLRSYSNTEMTKCWLTPQDNLRIQKDIKRTAKYMRRGNDDSALDGICTRGLEHMRNISIYQELTHEKDHLIEAVLAEQSSKHETNASKRVSITSSILSKRARDRAVLKADHDAAFVKNHVAYSWM